MTALDAVADRRFGDEPLPFWMIAIDYKTDDDGVICVAEASDEDIRAMMLPVVGSMSIDDHVRRFRSHFIRNAEQAQRACRNIMDDQRRLLGLEPRR